MCDFGISVVYYVDDDAHNVHELNAHANISSRYAHAAAHEK